MIVDPKVLDDSVPVFGSGMGILQCGSAARALANEQARFPERLFGRKRAIGRAGSVRSLRFEPGLEFVPFVPDRREFGL